MSLEEIAQALQSATRLDIELLRLTPEVLMLLYGPGYGRRWVLMRSETLQRHHGFILHALIDYEARVAERAA